MSLLLLDTDVFSYLVKGDSRALQYASVLEGHSVAISFMTVAELYQWASSRNWGSKRVSELEAVIKAYIIPPVDAEVCRQWGRIRARRRAAGRPISPQDAWIAATALCFDLPLVTHNSGDYTEIDGLDVHTVDSSGGN